MKTGLKSRVLAMLLAVVMLTASLPAVFVGASNDLLIGAPTGNVTANGNNGKDAKTETIKGFMVGNSLSMSISIDRLKALFASQYYDLKISQQMLAGTTLAQQVGLRNVETGEFVPVNASNKAASSISYSYFDAMASEAYDFASLQLYLNYLETPAQYVDKVNEEVVLTDPWGTFNPYYYLGDLDAASLMIDYALEQKREKGFGTNTFIIYQTWPDLLSFRDRQVDTDGDGIYEYSEYWEAPYNPDASMARTAAGNQAATELLMESLRERYKGQDVNILLVNAGGILSVMDEQIKGDSLPGFEAYMLRNAQYYLNSRNGGTDLNMDGDYTDAGETSEPVVGMADALLTNAFVKDYGILNLYSDRVHLCAYPHASEEDGTLASYMTAMAMYTAITGNSPVGLPVETNGIAGDKASYVRRLDATLDAALIESVQKTVLSVMAKENPSISVTAPVREAPQLVIQQLFGETDASDVAKGTATVKNLMDGAALVWQEIDATTSETYASMTLNHTMVYKGYPAYGYAVKINPRTAGHYLALDVTDYMELGHEYDFTVDIQGNSGTQGQLGQLCIKMTRADGTVSATIIGEEYIKQIDWASPNNYTTVKGTYRHTDSTVTKVEVFTNVLTSASAEETRYYIDNLHMYEMDSLSSVNITPSPKPQKTESGDDGDDGYDVDTDITPSEINLTFGASNTTIVDGGLGTVNLNTGKYVSWYELDAEEGHSCLTLGMANTNGLGVKIMSRTATHYLAADVTKYMEDGVAYTFSVDLQGSQNLADGTELSGGLYLKVTKQDGSTEVITLGEEDGLSYNIWNKNMTTVSGSYTLDAATVKKAEVYFNVYNETLSANVSAFYFHNFKMTKGTSSGGQGGGNTGSGDSGSTDTPNPTTTPTNISMPMSGATVGSEGLSQLSVINAVTNTAMSWHEIGCSNKCIQMGYNGTIGMKITSHQPGHYLALDVTSCMAPDRTYTFSLDLQGNSTNVAEGTTLVGAIYLRVTKTDGTSDVITLGSSEAIKYNLWTKSLTTVTGTYEYTDETVSRLEFYFDIYNKETGTSVSALYFDNFTMIASGAQGGGEENPYPNGNNGVDNKVETIKGFMVGNSLSMSISIERLRELFASQYYDLQLDQQMLAGTTLPQQVGVQNVATGEFLPCNVYNNPASSITYSYFDAMAAEAYDFASLQLYLNYVYTPDAYKSDTTTPVSVSGQSGTYYRHYRQGDFETITLMIDYALAQKAANGTGTNTFIIYQTWPDLLSFRDRAEDTDGDGVYEFSEYYNSGYDATLAARATACTKAATAELMSALREYYEGEDVEIILANAGEMLSVMDEKIKDGTMTGFETYMTRNGQYYLNSRNGGTDLNMDGDYTDDGETSEPVAGMADKLLTSAYVQKYGVLNLYSDRVHLCAYPHAGAEDGTLASYMTAMAMYTAITGNSPVGLPIDTGSATLQGTYTQRIDPVADADLVRLVQEIVLGVMADNNESITEDAPVKPIPELAIKSTFDEGETTGGTGTMTMTNDVTGTTLTWVEIDGTTGETYSSMPAPWTDVYYGYDGFIKINGRNTARYLALDISSYLDLNHEYDFSVELQGDMNVTDTLLGQIWVKLTRNDGTYELVKIGEEYTTGGTWQVAALKEVKGTYRHTDETVTKVEVMTNVQNLAGGNVTKYYFDNFYMWEMAGLSDVDITPVPTPLPSDDDDTGSGDVSGGESGESGGESGDNTGSGDSGTTPSTPSGTGTNIDMVMSSATVNGLGSMTAVNSVTGATMDWYEIGCYTKCYQMSYNSSIGMKVMSHQVTDYLALDVTDNMVVGNTYTFSLDMQGNTQNVAEGTTLVGAIYLKVTKSDGTSEVVKLGEKEGLTYNVWSKNLSTVTGTYEYTDETVTKLEFYFEVYKKAEGTGVGAFYFDNFKMTGTQGTTGGGSTGDDSGNA